MSPPSAPAPDQLRRGPEEASHRLVLLHGWGADADDLLDLADLLVPPTVSVVALRAPEPHPSGYGRQWYDLQPIDWGALPAARASLTGRLQDLARSVPLPRTVLLGFSQGAALALDAGCALPLAGIVACSGYPHEGWQPPAAAALPPVLLSHGRQDPVVPYAASEELLRRLQGAGGRAELLPFEGGHTIDAAVLPVLAGFVRERLG
ncbi:MAG: alpha/beta hydrolase [Prochlorococcaceae cyanobacterium]|jgi:phospholipase/carboxylesterase